MGGSSPMGDVNYSSLRRVPPGSSPLASQSRSGASQMHYYGDPAVAGRKGSGLSQEVDSGSSSGSSSEDQGVQVEVIPEREVKAKTALKSGSASGDVARRRKSRR